jgi:ABC-type sugar transport system permease subunit
LTQGGPARATNVIVFHIYRMAFTFGEMGYASALSVILLALLLLISIVQVRLLRGDEV